MTDQTYDVAVVGASIAGSTAATLLAREGASVALIERHSDPNAYTALCTHFIQPSAIPTIERLMFSVAARDERAARRFHAFGSRSVGVREFLAPKAIAHALLVNARHAARRRGGQSVQRPRELPKSAVRK